VSERTFHNNPLWYPDDTGGGSTFEVDFENTAEPDNSSKAKIDLDEFERLLRENPVARAAAAQVLQVPQESQTVQSQTPSTPDPLSAIQSRLAEVTQQLEQNPQDANAFAEKIKLEAQLESLQQFQKLVEPVVIRQQVGDVIRTDLPKILNELSKNYNDFDAIRDSVMQELVQQLYSNPALSADPVLLKNAAELVADHYFSNYVRKPPTGTSLPGNRAFARGADSQPVVKGLTAEESKAFQEAKRFYPDITPEDWKAYYKDEKADTDSQYRINLRNVAGRSTK